MHPQIVFALLLTATSAAFAQSPAANQADRDAQPLQPPHPTYPTTAATAGVTGVCNVHLDVTAEGAPVNVKAHCTAPVFVESAETAMRAVSFAPKMVAGKPAPRQGVVYPIEYRLE